jgi:hypothetical protein
MTQRAASPLGDAPLCQASHGGVLPTYSSWLNWIECELAALRFFALNGTDHRSHGEEDDAIGTYIRWRNQDAQPKRGFAVKSRIRLPDYLPYVASRGTSYLARVQRNDKSVCLRVYLWAT